MSTTTLCDCIHIPVGYIDKLCSAETKLEHETPAFGGYTEATAGLLLCHNPILCFLSVGCIPELAKDQVII